MMRPGFVISAKREISYIIMASKMGKNITSVYAVVV